MFKKTLLFSLFIFIFLISWKQDSYAKTWPRGSKIPAESIIAAIDRGESIIIDSCEILGVLKKEGTSPIFDTIPFVEERIDTIEGHISISRTSFSGSVIFRTCHFIEPVDFCADSFCEFVSFSNTTFGGNAYFWYSTFRGDARFKLTTFDSNANFDSVTFGGFAYFDWTTFSKKASFEHAIFDTNADFKEAKFDGSADFFQTAFDEKVCFNATFTGKAFFRQTIFDGDADFMNATFKAEVDLSPRKFQDINISWKQFEDHLVYDSRNNYKLMKYFEEQRQLDDADGVYLFLKDHERMEKSRLQRYLEYWLIQQTCGYGVDPLRPMATSLIIIGLFFVAYCVIDIKEKDLSPRILGLNGVFWNLYNGLYYSINTFIAGAPANWCPKDESKARFYLFRILTTIERTLGWILLVLFVVTLTRKFIR